MYTDYQYYTDEYHGRVIKSEEDFTRFARRAERRIDTITGNKLQSAFPRKKKDVETVKDCLCVLAEFLYQIDRYQTEAMENVGTMTREDGIVVGKVATSITSGSESVGYSSGGSVGTSIMEAAKDKKIADTMVYSMAREGLSGVQDANGVNLLYAGIS